MISVKPGLKANDNSVWGYLDDLYRSASFDYYGETDYLGLSAKRLLYVKII